MKINLSIIIPVYEAKNTIVKSIQSINNQILKTDLKMEVLLIIDDGKNYKNIIPKVNKSIKLKILSTGGIKTGPGNARNVGLLKAKGNYIGFLDADDEWSETYIENMYNLARKYDLAFAPTRVYRNEEFIHEFRGKVKDYLSITDIGEVPCSFHPFVKRERQGMFNNLKSQDVYNACSLINKINKKVKIATSAYYKLNLREKSVTTEDGFTHKINIAYKKNQIESTKAGNHKIARVFAMRRIINRRYSSWLQDNRGSFYEYLSQKEK